MVQGGSFGFDLANITLQEETFLPLVERYLASIPTAQQPPVLEPERITALPNGFPQGVVVEDVRCLLLPSKEPPPWQHKP